MRKLDLKEIQQLANTPGVKKQAVENFLLTVHNNSSSVAAYINLLKDSELYKWDEKTENIIAKGIALADEGIDENA